MRCEVGALWPGSLGVNSTALGLARIPVATGELCRCPSTTDLEPPHGTWVDEGHRL